jgi:LemA protein
MNTVKGYAAQESGVLQKVTEARTQAMNAGSMQEKLKDENILSGTLKSLFAVAESYPDLKSNQNFMQLQSDLTDTEDKIQF